MNVRLLLLRCRHNAEILEDMTARRSDRLDMACRGMSTRTARRLSGTDRREPVAMGAMTLDEMDRQIADLRAEYRIQRKKVGDLLAILDKRCPLSGILLRRYYVERADAVELAQEQHMSRCRLWREMGEAIQMLQREYGEAMGNG